MMYPRRRLIDLEKTKPLEEVPMRRLASTAFVRLLGLASLLAMSAPAAIITFTSQSLGGNNYRYIYDMTQAQITANQEIQIRFNASLYNTLSNATAPAPFSASVFQPNNPPNAPGDYLVFTTQNNPSMAGTFSVDFEWLGGGLPGAQPFFINQFDGGGSFLSVIESGTTQNAVPEPATLVITGIGLVALGVVRQRHMRRTTDTSK
jgi:hypothetical protein